MTVVVAVEVAGARVVVLAVVVRTNKIVENSSTMLKPDHLL